MNEIASNMGFWAFLATILGGGTFLGTVIGFLKWWYNQRQLVADRKIVTCFHNGLESIQSICSDLENLRSFSSIDEVIIFRAHNDGGLPKVGHPFYVSSVLWSIPRKEQNDINITLFQKINVVSDAIEYLCKVFNDHYYETDVASLKEGYTKDYFSLNGYNKLVFHFLSLTENTMFFLVLASKNDFVSHELDKANFIIHRIAENFNH